MADLFISREQAQADLLAAAAFIGERIRSSDGHAEAMDAIIPQYLQRDDVDLAAELANAVDDPFSRDRLLTQVAIKCAEMDDDEYALQLTAAIEDDGIRSQCRERVALVKAENGEADRAETIAAELQHPDEVYAGIAAWHSAKGNEAAAGAMLDRIDFPAAKVSALQHMAAGLLDKEQFEKAAEALETASAAAKEIEHDEERIRALCDLGNAYIQAKRSDKAVEAFNTARSEAEVLGNIHRDFFLVNCALGFLHAGSAEFAEGTLDLVTDKTQMASALLGFARDHWKKGEQDDALDALDEAYQILRSQKEIETRDSKGTNSLMTSIAAQFAAWDKAELALTIAHENKDPEEVTSALTQIAQVLTLRGDDEQARGVVNQIAEDSDRVIALMQVADTKLSMGETASAVSMLSESMQLAETIPQMVSRAWILESIASRFHSAGETQRSREAALAALAAIAEIRDQAGQATALAELAKIYPTGAIEAGEDEKRIVDRLLTKADQ